MNQRLRLRSALLFSAFATSIGLSQSAKAEGPTTASYPYGKQWQGNRYGPIRPWWSAGVVVGVKPSRVSDVNKTRMQFMPGVEGRYHFSPRLALVLSAHFAGHEVTGSYKWVGVSSDEESDGLEVGSSTTKNLDTLFTYREGVWALGADFGIWETKTAHFQVGPRVGIQKWKTKLDLDFGDDDEPTDDWVESARKGLGASEVSAVDLSGGLTARLGAFPSPELELGLHAHFEYIYELESGNGSLGSGTGLEVGPYAVMHF